MDYASRPGGMGGPMKRMPTLRMPAIESPSLAPPAYLTAQLMAGDGGLNSSSISLVRMGGAHLGLGCWNQTRIQGRDDA